MGVRLPADLVLARAAIDQGGDDRMQAGPLELRDALDDGLAPGAARAGEALQEPPRREGRMAHLEVHLDHDPPGARVWLRKDPGVHLGIADPTALDRVPMPLQERDERRARRGHPAIAVPERW